MHEFTLEQKACGIDVELKSYVASCHLILKPFLAGTMDCGDELFSNNNLSQRN